MARATYDLQPLPGKPLIFRNEYIRWSLAIFCSLLLFVCAAILINGYYNPDIHAALERARNLSVRPLGAFRPEPKEKAIFLCALISIPVALTIFYLLSDAVVRRIPRNYRDGVYYVMVLLSVLIICYVGYAGLVAPNPFRVNLQNSHDVVAATNLQFFLIATFLYNHFYLYLFVIFPAIALLLFINDQLNFRNADVCRQVVRWFMYLCSGLLVLVVFFINVFKFPYTFENKYDFNAVYYSMVQVYNGIPMLVDNFTNTYGLYPHFLVPVFKIIGLNIANFSGLMAFLNALCYLIIFWFLRKNIRSSAIVFLCYCSLLYYSHLYFKIITNFDSIFASQPIRFVLPVLSFVLASIYLKNKARMSYVVSMFLLSFGVLWNPEFGSITLVAYLLFLCYTEFEHNNIGRTIRGMVLHLVCGAATLATSFAFYSFIIRLFYGSYPQLFEMFNMIKMFSVIGAGMLPMPLLHPWNLIALVYVVGLSYSISAVVNRTYSERTAIVFFVTILGIGMFSYYQGRSHSWNLMHSFVYAFILIGIFADSLQEIAKREKMIYMPLALIVFVIGSSLFQIAYHSAEISRLFFEENNKAANYFEQNEIMRNAQFIKENTAPGEKVLIIARDYYQGLYYDLSHTAAAINPGLQDLFYRSDYDNLLLLLVNNKQIKVFFEPRVFKFYDTKIPMLLSSLYDIEKTNSAMILLKKRGGSGT